MAFFDDLKKKYTELLSPVKQSLSTAGSNVSDNQGWYRGGQFTPIKQISEMVAPTKLGQTLSSPNLAQNVGDYWRNTNAKGVKIGNTQIGGGPVFTALGNFGGNTVQSLISGAQQTAKGLDQTGFFGGKPNSIGSQLQGLVKTGMGVAKVAAPFTPLYNVANAVSSMPGGGGADLPRRLSAGLLGGMTGLPLAPNVPSRETNLGPLGGVDLAKTAGSMYGFTKNPAWQTIFGKTSAIAEAKWLSNPVTNYLATKGVKGGLEGLIQGLGDMADNLTTKQKAEFMAKNVFFGVGSEIVFDIASKKTGELAKRVWNGREKTEALAKAYDAIRDLKGRYAKVADRVNYPAMESNDIAFIKNYEAKYNVPESPLRARPMATAQEMQRYRELVTMADRLKQGGYINFGEMKPGKDQPTKVGGEGIKGLSNVENKPLQQPAELAKIQPKQVSQLPTLGKSSLDSLAQAKKLEESISRVAQESDMAKAGAEIAKQTRQIFSPQEIQDINSLKKISRSKAFLEGDIETLRKTGNADVVNRAIEAVKIANPNIKSEAEALDYALSLPTKAETVVKKPQLTPEEKQLRFEVIKKDQQFNQDFGQVVKEIKAAGADKSLFEQSGATLTPKQFSNLQSKKIRIQSEASKKAVVEADKYFKDISTPAYKQGKVNLGDSVPTDELLKAQKDKMSLAYWRETIQRNVEDTFGKDSKMKKFVVDNMTNNENKATQFQNELKTKLGKTFEGIKKGSKEDMAMGDYIEKNITVDQLKKEFPSNWQKIVNGAEAGRVVYKDLLGKINEQLQRFGYDPIPERQNYVTHTNQLQTFSEKVGNLFNVNSDNLPREMSGINMEVKPGRKFFNFGLERKGGSTHEGLITALEKYIPSATRQIYHTEDIQRGRAILDFLQKSAGEGDTRLSNFTSYFSEYVDHLAGKQNVLDRGVEKVLGRKFLAVGSWVKSRTGANMVGGNVSSALTNFIPFTQSIATTNKKAVVRGLAESATNFGKDPSVVDGTTSGFLLRRFAKERISSTLGESIQDKASLLFKIIDKFTSTSVVAGKYFEGLQKGLSKEKAMAFADDYAQRVMADRSFGQSPLLFNSKVLGALTQFQLEVNNQMSFLLKDIPKNMGYSKAQVVSSLVQFGIYSYLFNELYQKVTGRRPQIDPIHIVGSTAQDLAEGKGLQAFNPMSPTGGFNDQTGTGELLNQLPFSSVGAGRIPAGQALTNPQYYLLPPFGGGQLKKTIEGIKAFNQGGSFTNAGNVRFPIDQNTPNRIRTALFGQYSTPEAVDFYKSGNKPLSDANSEMFKSFKGQAQKDLYTQSQAKTDQEAQDKKIMDQLKGKEPSTSPLLNLPIIKSLSGSQPVLPVSSDIKPEYANKIAKVGGKYAYITASGDSQKVDTLREAEIGVEKALFKNSSDNFKDLGDTVLRKSPTGDITTQSKTDYNISLYDAKMTSLKKKDDTKAWLDVAKQQLETLNTKLNSPSTDELEKLTIQNKIDTLSASIQKTIAYGGFKKPKKPKKISIKKPKTLKLKSIKVKKIKMPKIKKVKKLKMPKRVKLRI